MDLRHFWGQVAVRGPDDCWLWLGSVNNSGYGTLEVDGKTYVAHRVAAWVCGMVPTLSAPPKHSEPNHVLHHCDVRRCCHPGHFFTGTYGDNARDAYGKGRRWAFRGADHPNAKVSWEDVAQIRALYFSGVKQKELATRFGVTQSAVSGYVRGETYATRGH